ncbi:MAG TPA: hypothetical protein PK201_07730, partial [Accumulibacter sp.]|nr:hypothetical protein [Accumulibacter sp.]
MSDMADSLPRTPAVLAANRGIATACGRTRPPAEDSRVLAVATQPTDNRRRQRRQFPYNAAVKRLRCQMRSNAATQSNHVTGEVMGFLADKRILITG